MELGKFIKINNEQVPNPESFDETLNPSENIYESEAGTQLANIVRLDRYSFSASWNCSSRFKAKFLAWCKLASVDVTINGVTTSGRMRLGGSISLVEDSANVGGTEGLWTVPITFEGE